MPRIEVDPVDPDPQVIDRAAAILRGGGLVAFPTETVYGLGANALDPAAVERIYAAKGRPSYNPLIVHVDGAERALSVVSAWPDRARRLAEAFWPGPLTMVLPKRDVVPDAVTAGFPSVAVRNPAHPVARMILAAAALPIAAPSANPSTRLSPTTGRHVERLLGDAVDLIIDAGATPVGIESTIVDLTVDPPRLLRPGTISVPELEAVIGPVERAGAIVGEAPRPAPGMLDKHYAPRGRVKIVDRGDIAATIDRERTDGQRVGALVIDAAVEQSGTILRLPRDPRAYASALYGSLHTLDDADCDVIIVERVPEEPQWLGVRDRLERASR